MIIKEQTIQEKAKLKYNPKEQQPKNFAAFIEKLVSDIPPDILESLPTEVAPEHDHYIYGTEKRKS